MKYEQQELTEIEKKLDKIIEKSNFCPKADTVLINLTPIIHCLSKEEQIYFRNITEAIFGYSEQVRNENLKLLSTDYHVNLVMPYLSCFIKETIHCNIILTDLTLLIYAVRMTKSLLTNHNVCLKPYIHEILPAVISCALSKKISKYYNDNHWTLRDFSAFVVASICQKYSDDLNNMKQRVINLYVKGIKDVNKGLTTAYGAIKGISSFGENEIKMYLLPQVMLISSKIQKILEMNNFGIYLDFQKQQMNEAKHVRNVMVTICAPILYKSRNMNDGGLSYVKDFGYLGKSMYIQVKNIESMEQARIQQAQYMQKISNFFQASNNTSNSSNINNINQSNASVNPTISNVSYMPSGTQLKPNVVSLNPSSNNINSSLGRMNPGPNTWFNIPTK